MRVEVITSPTGQRRAYIREGYRDERGRATKRTVVKLGLVDDLEAADPGWRAKAEARAAELAGAKGLASQTLTVDWAVPADPRGAANVGWQVVDAVWDALGLGPWLKRRARESGWGGNVADTLRVLVACQVLWPGSKRAAVANAGRLWGAAGLDLKATYRALDKIAEVSVQLQSRARRAVAGPQEVLEVVFYDVTNYFFAIDQPDPVEPGDHDPPRAGAARRRGACKERRPESIVQMGLFMDTTGLPVSYRLFHGSSPDCVTLRGALAEFKDRFGAPKVTVVADAAMNNAANIVQLAGQGDDWVFAASIRKAPAKTRAWALDPEGWTHQIDADGLLATKTKSMLATRTVSYKTPEGKRVKRQVTEKIIVRWSADYANRQRLQRAEMAAKAAKLAADPSAWKALGKKGAGKYVRAEQADPVTGEVQDACPVLSLDAVKLQDDAAMDGYWLLHTSQTDVCDHELLAHYAQLWQIEDAFRVTKTELRARPVFLRTGAHIEAHFAVCFLALLATRLLQRCLALPAGQIRDLLAQLSISHADADVYLINRPAGWDQIDEQLDTDTNKKWTRITALRNWRRTIGSTITTAITQPQQPTR